MHGTCMVKVLGLLSFSIMIRSCSALHYTFSHVVGTCFFSSGVFMTRRLLVQSPDQRDKNEKKTLSVYDLFMIKKVPGHNMNKYLQCGIWWGNESWCRCSDMLRINTLDPPGFGAHMTTSLFISRPQLCHIWTDWFICKHPSILLNFRCLARCKSF